MFDGKSVNAHSRTSNDIEWKKSTHTRFIDTLFPFLLVFLPLLLLLVEQTCTILTNNRGISIYWLAANTIKDPLVFAYLFSNQVTLYPFWRFYSRWILRPRAGTSGYWKVRVRSRDVLPLRRVSRSFPACSWKIRLTMRPARFSWKIARFYDVVCLDPTNRAPRWWCHGCNVTSFFLAKSFAENSRTILFVPLPWNSPFGKRKDDERFRVGIWTKNLSG